MTSLEYYNTTKDLNDMIYERDVRLLEKICIELDAVDRIDELKAKYLDESFTKIKAKKDPNKPKMPMSCFLLFCKEHRESVKSENPDFDFISVNKQLGAKWKQLEDKQKYIEMANENKQVYLEELEQYKKENGILF